MAERYLILEDGTVFSGEGFGAPAEKGFLPHAGEADDPKKRFLSRFDRAHEGFGFLPEFAQVFVARRPFVRLHERNDGFGAPQEREAKAPFGERLDGRTARALRQSPR